MVGRKLEQELLQEAVEKNRAQFVAVYGRRRVGKTFLVNEFFQNKKTNTKHGCIVNRLNAYYRYFSQYEHFSEQGYGDSIAPFGSDNVSFPLAIDALEEGLKVIVKI